MFPRLQWVMPMQAGEACEIAVVRMHDRSVFHGNGGDGCVREQSGAKFAIKVVKNFLNRHIFPAFPDLGRSSQRKRFYCETFRRIRGVIQSIAQPPIDGLLHGITRTLGSRSRRASKSLSMVKVLRTS